MMDAHSQAGRNGMQRLLGSPVPARLAIGPGGVRPTFPARHGHEVVKPKLPVEDFAEVVQIAQIEFDGHQPDVVVGSSRGGAVAVNVNRGEAKLALVCPV